MALSRLQARLRGLPREPVQARPAKVASPKILYTVSELKNCAGSCHVYTNATLTTSKQRSNEHRPTGDF